MDTPIKKTWKFSSEQKNEMVRMYGAGHSFEHIGRTFGASARGVAELLEKRIKSRGLAVGRFNPMYRNASAHRDGRIWAQSTLWRAIRSGRFQRVDHCESCGVIPRPYKNGRSAIHAHHCDYNKPLDVMWLCNICHHEWHQINNPIPKVK
jgi:hypothetical protein